MLYEIDVFGFCPGFIQADWTLMSERDIKENENLRKELEYTKYNMWKRRNILKLVKEYDELLHRCNFEAFCKDRYESIK